MHNLLPLVSCCPDEINWAPQPFAHVAVMQTASSGQDDASAGQFSPAEHIPFEQDWAAATASDTALVVFPCPVDVFVKVIVSE